MTHEEGNEVTTGTTAAETWVLALLIVGGVCAMRGCTPRVEVVPSDKPITISLNVIGLSEGTTSTLGVQPFSAQTPPNMSSVSAQALVAVCTVVTLLPSS